MKNFLILFFDIDFVGCLIRDRQSNREMMAAVIFFQFKHPKKKIPASKKFDSNQFGQQRKQRDYCLIFLKILSLTVDRKKIKNQNQEQDNNNKNLI